MPAPGLSVVVPVYNEAGRIETSLHVLLGFLVAHRLDAEVVCVDDGSTDGSGSVLARVAGTEPRVRRVSLGRNHGKGAAVRRGMLEARGDAAVFMDADLSTDLAALPASLRALADGADVVLGSRRVPAARIVTRQPLARDLLGRGFSAMAGLLVDRSVPDFTCGFKAFTAAAGHAIFSRSRIAGWAFDVEIVAIARTLGLRVVSVPVDWHDEPRSKVRVPRAVLSSLVDLVRIAWLHQPAPAPRVSRIGRPAS